MEPVLAKAMFYTCQHPPTQTYEPKYETTTTMPGSL